MKKLYLLIVFSILAAVSVSAQEKGRLTPEKHKEFREYKMKFLAQEMDLKEESRKKFFEMYNELSDERHDLRHEMRDINRKIKNGTATDADYSTLNRLKEKEAEIEKKYDSKFSTFLSSREIYKMKEAENTFKQKIQEMKAKKEKKK